MRLIKVTTPELLSQHGWNRIYGINTHKRLFSIGSIGKTEGKMRFQEKVISFDKHEKTVFLRVTMPLWI